MNELQINLSEIPVVLGQGSVHGRQTGRFHGSQVNSSQLCQHLLKPGVQTLERSLGSLDNALKSSLGSAVCWSWSGSSRLLCPVSGDTVIRD